MSENEKAWDIVSKRHDNINFYMQVDMRLNGDV